jgi:hypothetical protein
LQTYLEIFRIKIHFCFSLALDIFSSLQSFFSAYSLEGKGKKEEVGGKRYKDKKQQQPKNSFLLNIVCDGNARRVFH